MFFFKKETAYEIETGWVEGKDLIGVTAGASTAEWTVDEVIKRLEEMSQATTP